DARLFGAVPAIALSPTTTAYLAENDSDPHRFCSASSMVLTAITGVPSATQPSPSPANRADTCLPMMATNIPPPAGQPNNGTTIDTGDDRFLSATCQTAVLSPARNYASIPTADT